MRYFPSERDWWFGVIVWALCPVMLAALLILQIRSPAPWGFFLAAGILPTAASWALLLWIWFSTGYTLTETHLIVRSAFLTWQYPLASVKRVRPTRSPLSAPALSMNRLEIQLHRRASILVSPKDREEFLRILRVRCPEAEIRGDTR